MTVTNAGSLTILQRLAGGDLLIADGATGTYLHKHGLRPGSCPEAMNVTHPAVVRQAAAEFFAAGSDFVLTNSIGGNRFRLEKYGHGHRVREFNRLAVEHARSATPEGRYVVATAGPTGEFLAPLGDVSNREMYDAFAEQVTAFEEGGADGVIFETMSALEEVTLAIKAARENTGLMVIGSMVFEKGPGGLFTMMGVTPEQAAEGMLAAGADAVGSNCGNGIDVMVEVAERLRRATDGHVIVQSNAGLPRVVGGETVFPETPEYMAERF
ncbi:MAG: homocysteine S-methyltransferase family protein, partial [Gemmatimonadetes bacterium]|nr:homocysteine S-methyltransferase family protein [Gemmatimonadota bacterium]